MNKVFALGLLSAGLLGCASEPLQLESERTYQAEWINGKPRLHHSHPTLTLGDDGRAYGSAGCNHWFAAYTREADKLSFAQIGSTRKMCAPAANRARTKSPSFRPAGSVKNRPTKGCQSDATGHISGAHAISAFGEAATPCAPLSNARLVC